MTEESTSNLKTAAGNQQSAGSRIPSPVNRRLSTVISCLSFLLIIIPHLCFAQSASATLDREKIILGEQVTLELKAGGVNAASEPLLQWFSLPDTANHIEVIKRSPVDTIVFNGATTYSQTLTLTSFDSGEWKLPPLIVVVQREGNRTDTVATNTLTLDVLPVDISDMKDYHPIKDIIDVEVQPDYLLMAGIVLLILLVAAAVWFVFLRKKEHRSKMQPVAERSLFETTIAQLEKLAKDNPPAMLFYTRMDEICRLFIQNQLHIRALQLTTDELMTQLNVYMKPEARTDFYQLLRLISAVKFAKYTPAEGSKANSIAVAKEGVQHIYHHLQRSTLPHAT